MAARKVQKTKTKEKKPRAVSTSTKVGVNVDIDALEDAVVDGKIVVPVDSKLLTVRTYSTEVMKCTCIVKRIDEDLVSCWDETMEYWYCFNPSQIHKHNLIIKVLKRAE